MRRPLLAPVLVLLASCSFGQSAGNGGNGRHPDGGGTPDGGDGAATVIRDGGPGGSMDGGATGNPGDDGGGTGGDDSGTVVNPDDDGGSATDEDADIIDPTTGCGPREICDDGYDNNCDSQVDEGCICQGNTTQQCYDGPPALAGHGVCTFGVQTCIGGSEFGQWGVCTGAGRPADTVCGSLVDSHCNGLLDDGCDCVPDTVRPCYSGPTGTEGRGLCRAGSQRCTGTTGSSMWGACTGDVTPHPELCDGVDRDCDGRANSGCVCTRGSQRACYTGPAGTSGVGLCHDGVQTCVPGAGGNGAMWGACAGDVTPTADHCDGRDYACNGNPGTGCVCTVGATRGCFTGAAGTRGVGACHDGVNHCTAMGATAGWDAACEGQVTAVAEVCNNAIDDNCNGAVDENCGGVVVCPGDETVLAGQSITLTAGGSGLHNFTWSIVSAPTGGASTAQWSSTSGQSVGFTPYIVGVYVIRVSAVDASGHTVTCMFSVSALPHGLRVQLTWDGSGDLDLHVHNGNNSAWYNGDDCFYSDLSPGWGARLDFDNTDRNGPENIRVDNPVVGQAYEVAVHNYSRGGGRTATVQVFCGATGVVTPTLQVNSRPLSGGSSGNCTGNDFWRVATVTFTSATTCTVNMVNTYTGSNNACGTR